MQRKHILAPIKNYGSVDGFQLAFTGTATCSMMDRDGDVLKSSGARLDPRCPLLWQHDSTLPVGKVIKSIAHTADRLDVLCGITDFGDSQGALASLARDVAVLVKSGVVALSIGFDPTDYHAMSEDKGRYQIDGFEIMELSIVSVPSNRGALIHAVDSGKFRSAILKGYTSALKSFTLDQAEEDAAEFDRMFATEFQAAEFDRMITEIEAGEFDRMFS